MKKKMSVANSCRRGTHVVRIFLCEIYGFYTASKLLLLLKEGWCILAYDLAYRLG